VTPCGTLPLF